MAQIIADIDDTILPNGNEWYYERSVGSDDLLIVTGDSWTWGDSLDRRHRTENIYGTQLAKMLNCDLINIGIPGGSNLYILEHLRRVLTSLKKNYRKRYTIFTLSESGRELGNNLLHQKKHYQDLAGEDWPEFELLVKGQYTKSSIELMMSEISGSHFEHVVGLFLELLKSDCLVDLLRRYEEYTIRSIKKTAGDDIYLARSFTSCLGGNRVDAADRWVDIIARRGSLDPYPDDVYMMTPHAINPVVDFCDHYFQDFDRGEWVRLFDAATSGIDWLSASPFNGNHTSRHPLEQAHYWWAEYLYGELQTR